MIDEAIGKILGMAMAYGVSSLGLFLAYVNYRKRIVKADKVMTGTAWMVIVAIVVAIGAGVVVVSQLAEAPTEAPAVEEVAEAAPVPSPAPPTPAPARATEEGEVNEWPLLGIVLPGCIFLFATWVTASLYRHFTTHGHGGSAEGAS